MHITTSDMLSIWSVPLALDLELMACRRRLSTLATDAAAAPEAIELRELVEVVFPMLSMQTTLIDRVPVAGIDCMEHIETLCHLSDGHLPRTASEAWLVAEGEEEVGAS